ncbi:MAG TPA: MerR family transcriptional regulator [Candidatus Pelethocola excrementipullorum]|nr:MerR family transcriptional regulator [Candidatus Pelethocola excrementipullorum]
MKRNNLLTISEFSKITDVSRKALIFYDNIGLFSPEFTGENGYRYYSREQIYMLSVISILKEFGMPLIKIREYMKNCTPLETIQLLEQQEKNIEQRIKELQGAQDMLDIRMNYLKQGIDSDIQNIGIIKQEKTPLFVGDSIDVEKTLLSDEHWLPYDWSCKDHGITFGYPEGFIVKKENICNKRTDVVDKIICYLGNPIFANEYMPAGSYLVGCGTGGFEDTEPIYQRMLQYIEEHQLEIDGNAYEERLIDEVGSKDKTNQIIQIKIKIRQRAE